MAFEEVHIQKRKNSKKKYKKKVSKSCPDCDNILEAEDFTTLLEHIQNHISLCEAKNKSNIPNDKSVWENEFETVVKGVKELRVGDMNTIQTVDDIHCCPVCSYSAINSTQLKNHIRCDHELNAEDKVPERLCDMLGMIGQDINEVWSEMCIIIHNWQ